jgi:hypothetical protein
LRSEPGERFWAQPDDARPQGVARAGAAAENPGFAEGSTMRKDASAWLAASVLLLAPSAGRAQGLDLSGSWNVQMTALRPTKAIPVNSCSFEGPASVVQAGSQLSGNVAVTLTTGGLTCPPFMAGTLTGNVTGNQVTMGAMMGSAKLGQATFTGTATARRASATSSAPDVNSTASSVTGTFAVTSGPFSGTTGTFSAAVQPAGIPTLGGRGQVLLALLLVGTALGLFWRRGARRSQ